MGCWSSNLKDSEIISSSLQGSFSKKVTQNSLIESIQENFRYLHHGEETPCFKLISSEINSIDKQCGMFINSESEIINPPVLQKLKQLDSIKRVQKTLRSQGQGFFTLKTETGSNVTIISPFQFNDGSIYLHIKLP